MDILTKTPAAIKNFSYNLVDKIIVKPAKYVFSLSSKLKNILLDGTMDYVKSKFIKNKNE
jgi:hypothetical protein